jgi:septation ring formation regulator EzrA
MNDLAHIDIPEKPKRIRMPGVAKMRARLKELEAEHARLQEKYRIAEEAACANLAHAQGARSAIEDLAEKILARLPPLPEGKP